MANAGDMMGIARQMTEPPLRLPEDKELRIASYILTFHGSYVPLRHLHYLKIGKKANVDEILAVMNGLGAAPPSPNHFGTVAILRGNSKVFYKCPPHLLHSDANLERFGLTRERYSEFYYSPQTAYAPSAVITESYRRLLEQSSPYLNIAVPVQEMESTVDHQWRIDPETSFLWIQHFTLITWRNFRDRNNSHCCSAVNSLNQQHLNFFQCTYIIEIWDVFGCIFMHISWIG